jgi:hypothetical protein
MSVFSYSRWRLALIQRSEALIAGPGRRRRSRRQPFVPRLEVLEDRTVPSVLVTTNADSGPGSLRDAIATVLRL